MTLAGVARGFMTITANPTQFPDSDSPHPVDDFSSVDQSYECVLRGAESHLGITPPRDAYRSSKRTASSSGRCRFIQGSSKVWAPLEALRHAPIRRGFLPASALHVLFNQPRKLEGVKDSVCRGPTASPTRSPLCHSLHWMETLKSGQLMLRRVSCPKSPDVPIGILRTDPPGHLPRSSPCVHGLCMSFGREAISVLRHHSSFVIKSHA